MSLIEMTNVVKEFTIKQRAKGFRGSVSSIFAPKFIVKQAVDDISFQVERGEIVGYIGPNGAGKSTTIKMLTGILVPTSGRVSVCGLTPSKNRKQNAMHMGAVFGQRSQLLWDLPIGDTFELYKQMYRIPDSIFLRNRAFYIERLGIDEFLYQPARQLSLGQKMRANIVLALLHDPQVLFLDEPTIGLDVLAKVRIRQFIRELSDEKGTTVILTTHDMDDIESTCRRIILIDKGKKLYDGQLAAFRQKYADSFQLHAVFAEGAASIDDDRFVFVRTDGETTIFSLDKESITPNEALMLAARTQGIHTISIHEPSMDEIVYRIYDHL